MLLPKSIYFLAQQLHFVVEYNYRDLMNNTSFEKEIINYLRHSLALSDQNTLTRVEN